MGSMTDNEITEVYFKARGWELGNWQWFDCTANKYYTIPNERPQILTDYPAFKEHVLEVMGEEGFSFEVSIHHRAVDWWKPNVCFSAAIIDNNILHAAVIAATQYFKDKK